MRHTRVRTRESAIGSARSAGRGRHERRLMRISDDIANVLGNSRIDDGKLYLPAGQLERNLYLGVNKVLEAIGGKWSRKEKAHLFDQPVSDILEEILLTGEYTNAKTEYQFFETPGGVACDLVALADIRPGETCLEPSAGCGAIAKYIPGVDCVEINPAFREYLCAYGLNVVGKDFLQFDQPHDVIVANPPFSKQQDIDHVTHMIQLARRRVVSVMSASIRFRTNRKTVEFLELLERQDGETIDLPDNSFRESGSGVRTCVVRCDGNGLASGE